MRMTKKKVGQLSAELLQKEPESRDPIEIERVMQKEYLDNLIECCQTHKQQFPGNFFVIVITKNEKLMPNVFRNYFYARQSCPTPDYDQSVFAYNREDDRLEYVWTIPSKDTCIHLLKNYNDVAESEKQLLNFVFQFAHGTLMELAKKYNGEREDSSFLEN